MPINQLKKFFFRSNRQLFVAMLVPNSDTKLLPFMSIVALLFGLISQSAIAQTPLTLQLYDKPSFQFAGYYAAQKQGFYAEEGLNIRILAKTDQDPVMTVIQGKADYGIADSKLFLYQAQGQPIRILAAFLQHSTSELLVKKHSGVLTPYDLQGQRVLFNQRDSDALPLALLFKSLDVNPKLIRSRSAIETKALLDPNIVAISSNINSDASALQKAKLQVRHFRPQDYGIDLYGDMLYTSKQEVYTHPNRAAAFKRATIKGWHYALKNRLEMAEFISKQSNVTASTQALLEEATQIENLMDIYRVPVGDIDTGRIKFAFQLLKEYGFIEQVVSANFSIFQENFLVSGLTIAEHDWIAAHPQIRLAVNTNTPPIAFFNARNALDGLSSEVLNNIRISNGIQINTLSGLTPEDALQQIRSKKLDAFLSTSKHLDKGLLHSKTIATFPMVFVTQLNQPYLKDLKALQQKKIALSENNPTALQMAKAYPTLSYKWVETPKEGLQAVEQGEAYVYVGSLATVSYLINHEQHYDLQIAGEAPVKEELHFVIRKDWPELKSILDKTLTSFTPQETNDLLAKWLPITYKKELAWNRIAMIFVPLSLLLLLLAYRNQKLRRKVKALTSTQSNLQDSNEQLSSLSLTDNLTGVYNRRHLDKVIEQELDRAQRYGGYLSILILDLDHFKRVNDNHGHLIGDEVLILTSGLVKKMVRKSDTFGRWGGEEFVLICPNTDQDQAAQTGEKIRFQIANSNYPENIQQTVSIGVACYKTGQTAQEWLDAADEALYQAKEQGRNQVVISC